MASDEDFDDRDGDDADRKGPPSASRIDRQDERRYRTLSRPGEGNQRRDRYPRLRKQHRVAELLGLVLEGNGLTEEVRKYALALNWVEIIGEPIASKTMPTSFVGVLMHASAVSSTWLHELQFLKAKLIHKINNWVDANRSWLGRPAPITDIRFALGSQRREHTLDSDHIRRLQANHERRTSKPPVRVPPSVSNTDRDAIRRETTAIDDPELRAIVADVRMKWNR